MQLRHDPRERLGVALENLLREEVEVTQPVLLAAAGQFFLKALFDELHRRGHHRQQVAERYRLARGTQDLQRLQEKTLHQIPVMLRLGLRRDGGQEVEQEVDRGVDLAVLVERIIGVTPGFSGRDTAHERPATSKPRQMHDREEILGVGFAIHEDHAATPAQLLVDQREEKGSFASAGPADDNPVRERGL